MATTNAQRIQYDDGGVARGVWLRSPGANNTSGEYVINTGGAIYNRSANSLFAFHPVMCI